MVLCQVLVGEARRRGRPPALDRAAREALIFDATLTLVAESGLSGVSMTAIARAAGMSKRTLYEMFDSRDALFVAWVRGTCAQIVRPVPVEASNLPLRERLHLLLGPASRRLSEAVHVQALRMVVAESPRQPELARLFLSEGLIVMRRLVHEELARAFDRGEITQEATDDLANILIDMTHENPILRLVDPDWQPSDEIAVERRLTSAINLFMAAMEVPEPALRQAVCST